jgi:hypothetical protein
VASFIRPGYRYNRFHFHCPEKTNAVVIINDDKRAIIWIPDMGTTLRQKTFTANDTKSLIASGKIKLRPKSFTTKDLPYLLASKALFARKFDENVDSKIFGLL